DNLQVLDPAHGLATLLQCSTGPGSNPHDVAVLAPDKAYVTRYDAKELWIVDPSAASCAGFLRDTVDLSPWGDADGIPEMDQMALVGDRLFVSLERLDPFTLTAEGFFVGESDLGGNITDFVLVSPTKGYAIVLDDQLRNILLAFDPSERRVTRRLLTRTQYLPGIALSPDGILWVADDGLPAPGIRLFDPRNDRELTRGAIDVGLPPFSIGFIP